VDFSRLLNILLFLCHAIVNSFHSERFFGKAAFFHNLLADFCCMFQKLKERWRVNTLDLILILSTFAIGGSTCGKTAAWILQSLLPEKNIIWWFIYIVLVSLLWPIAVLLVSVPLGQFRFFSNYLKKIWGRISGKKSSQHD
jgi:hypothetical protein